MIKIELVVKGSKGNLIIKGSTFEEVLAEYERNKKKITGLLGGHLVSARTIEKPKVTSGTLQGRISALANEDFFQSPKTAKEVKASLRERGYTYSYERVSVALIRLVRKKYLRRLREERDGKDIYVYVNP